MWSAALGAVTVAILLVAFSRGPLVFFPVAIIIAILATPVLLLMRVLQERARNDERPPTPKG